MKIYRFDAQVGQPLEKFASTNVVLSHIMDLVENARVSCMHLGPYGVVGYHRATIPQLFLVVHGSGWVRGETGGEIPILPGRAAFWETGEGHESRTQSGMMAIVIEGKALNPDKYMARL